MQPEFSGLLLSGRYRLLDIVGQGRFGYVYLARDLQTNGVRAAKLLHRSFAVEGKFLQRFQREAAILQQLHSPHIVKLFDFGEQDGLNFIIMEYVPGLTLSQVLAEQERLPESTAVHIFRQILEGLATTHAAGIVHRDIKPANLIVVDGNTVKIADFGIARGIDASTLTGTDFLGTAFYSAPEQAHGESVDIRADIYSVGIVLYEMLTGQVVFDGESPLSVALKHLYEPVPSIRELAPDISPETEAIINNCLEKRPENRFDTPTDVLDALEGLPDRLKDWRRPALIDVPRVEDDVTSTIPVVGRATQQISVHQAPTVVVNPGACWFEADGRQLAVKPGFVVTTIGRTAPKSQVFPDIDLGSLDGAASISRRHARLIHREGAWFIQEDESRHGTFVNGSKLDPGELVKLADGDEVRFGAIKTNFRLPAVRL